MLVIGAVFALAMAIAGVSVIRGAAAAEAAQLMQPAPVMQPIINRHEPPLAETDPRLTDREQLKRYFLQDERGWPRR
jgi:hypothetical protein